MRDALLCSAIQDKQWRELTHRCMWRSSATSSPLKSAAQINTQKPIPARNEPLAVGVTFIESPSFLFFRSSDESDRMQTGSIESKEIRMLVCEPPGGRLQRHVALRISGAVWPGQLVSQVGCR